MREGGGDCSSHSDGIAQGLILLQMPCSLSHAGQTRRPRLCFVTYYSAAFNPIPCRLNLKLSYWPGHVFVCVYLEPFYTAEMQNKTKANQNKQQILLTSFSVLGFAQPELSFQPWIWNCGGTLLPSSQVPLFTYRHMSSRFFILSPASSHAHLPHSPKLSQKYPNFKYSLRFHSGSSHAGGTWCLCGSAVQ